MASLEIAEQYAAQAVAQYKQLTNLGCTPPNKIQWSDDLAYHLRWARRSDVTTAMLDRETSTRAAVIQGCTTRTRSYPISQDKTPSQRSDETARQYADTAVAQVKEAKKLGCKVDFSQPEWSDNYRVHYDWAAQVWIPESALQQAIARRAEVIAKCRPSIQADKDVTRPVDRPPVVDLRSKGQKVPELQYRSLHVPSQVPGLDTAQPRRVTANLLQDKISTEATKLSQLADRQEASPARREPVDATEGMKLANVLKWGAILFLAMKAVGR